MITTMKIFCHCSKLDRIFHNFFLLFLQEYYFLDPNFGLYADICKYNIDHISNCHTSSSSVAEEITTDGSTSDTNDDADRNLTHSSNKRPKIEQQQQQPRRCYNSDSLSLVQVFASINIQRVIGSYL